MGSPYIRLLSTCSSITACFLPLKSSSHLGFQNEETLSSILVLNFILTETVT